MSFRLKTIAGVALIVAVVLGTLLAVGFGYLSRSVERQFEQRSQSTLRTIVQAARDPLISSDLGSLDALAREIVTDPGVLHARVFDAQDRVVAQAVKPGATAAIDRVAAAEVQQSGTRFGRIELQLSAADLQDELRRAQRASLLLALAGTLLAALAAGLLGRYLTRPLADLSSGSAQLAAGELGVQVPVRGRDELGAAAEAFNRMSARLRESYAELDRRARDLRLILENIVDGVITLDERANIIDASPAAARIFGRDVERLRGTSMQALFAGEPAAAVATALDQLRERAQGEPLPLPAQRADGTPLSLELQFSRIDASGTAAGSPVALAVVRDVTARIETQQALAQREGQLREVLNATHDGIIVTDERGRIESFNRGAEALFGWVADEVVGRDLAVILPEAHRARHGAYMARYVAGAEASVIGQEREFEAVRRDGQPLWIALRVAEMNAGGRRRFLGVVHDITERRQSMEELRQAKEAAEQAAGAKSDFLANMSHEIRTPMHGVLGSLEMMRDTPLSPQQQRHLDTAATSAGLLLGVIDEILDFSRLEAGKLRIESIDFDLHRTVEDVTAMLSSRAHGKRLEL
ncbi:MAG: PAS domain S-box protein, partial [Rubrivivax sp.]|nr:PAS domain S-box protein [Rubrivivax sp.]